MTIEPQELVSTLSIGEDGSRTETVHEWFPLTRWAKEIFNDSTVNGLVSLDDGVITVRASNGTRQYRIVEEQPEYNIVIAELVEA